VRTSIDVNQTMMPTLSLLSHTLTGKFPNDIAELAGLISELDDIAQQVEGEEEGPAGE
jgi:hypothetical protein